MRRYVHLFFDLDHTLWDFENNSREALMDLHASNGLASHGISAMEFAEKYFEINAAMWSLYHRNLIDRDTLRRIRFEKTFEHFNITDRRLIESFPVAYLELLPCKKRLFPGAAGVLSLLGKKYTMHLITNGFSEVQLTKLHVSGLAPYFCEVIISDHTGFKKPDREIFEFALRQARAQKHHSLMIGDDLEADVGGALNAGLDVVFFNPNRREHASGATYEIHHLEELNDIL